MKIVYEVRNIASKGIIEIEADASLGDAARLMVEKDIGSIVVSKDGQKVGILTERDVLKRLCFDDQCAAVSIEDVMSTPLVTIDGGAAIGEAANLMAEKKIRRLLVIENGMVEGIITERDVLRGTLDVFRKLSDAWV